MANYKRIRLNNNSITETVDEDFSTVDSQVEKFSTDYTANKLNELYNEFDSITLDNSAIDTITQRNAKAGAKASARTVLYLSASCLVVALLLFLMVYNFFVISRVSNSIDILQDDLTYQEYQVAEKANKLDDLTDDAVLKKQLTDIGYAQVSSENVVVLNSAVGSYAPVSGESNWFDKFCEFVGQVFGG